MTDSLSLFKKNSASFVSLLALAAICLPAAATASAQAPAQAVGGKACADCHQDRADLFVQSVHGRLAPFELHGRAAGCEACHGPGSRHTQSLEARDIFNFKNVPVADSERMCLNCHADRVAHNWRQGEHAMNGVTCVQCHTIHLARQAIPVDRGFMERPALTGFKSVSPPNRASLAKPEAILCQGCHKDVVARMMLPSRHPVREGKMSCSSCHNVHGSEVAGLRTDERKNDLCLNCHASKQGPFVFDHAPVSEDCGSCHVPHGSVNNNLLKQNEPFLCLQCHEAHFHVGRSGISTAVSLPSGGSQNPFGESGWRRAFGTKCTQCHVSIHGSDLPSHSLTGRGKALIR
ncbi:MAG: GSU2203 family decaheme c-type cytochrome [Acidobacteriota bacterium]